MTTMEYRDSVLVSEEDVEICPNTAVVRYWLDQHSWIEITQTIRGIELRSDGGKMTIEPISGNNVEVFVRRRS